MTASQGEAEGDGIHFRYTFHNQWMLRLALVHSSAFPVPGAPCSSGISLAWMGDAALNLIVSEQLMAAYCSASMGELTAARSRLVSREMCRRLVPAQNKIQGMANLTFVG